MTSVSSIASVLVERLGVAGIGLGVFLNGLGLPGFSEVLLPLGGVAARQGRLNLPLLLVVAVICQMIGVSVAYVIARAGGVPLIERYGKYVLISSRELVAAQKAFDRYGGRVVIVGSFTPGVQGFVGYVAGVAQMNYWRFLVSVFIGKLVWVSGLLFLGWVLGNQLALIDRSIQQIGIVILVGLVVAGIWYIRRHRRAKAAHTLGAKRSID